MAASRREYEMMFKLSAATDAKMRNAFRETSSQMQMLQSEMKRVNLSLKNIDAFQKAKKSSEKLTSSLAEQKKEMEGCRAKYNAAAEALEKLKKEQSQAGDGAEKFASKIKNQEKSVESAQKEFDRAAKKVQKLEERQKKATESFEKAKSALEREGIDTANLSAETDKLSRSFDVLKEKKEAAVLRDEKIAANNDKLKKSMSKLRSEAVMAAAAIGAVYGAAVKPSMDFNAEISAVGAIAGASEKERERLKADAKKTGLTHRKYTALDAANSMEYMAQAGWNTNEILSGYKGVLNMAAAGRTDVSAASDILTDALTAFKMKPSDSGRLADIMAATSAKSNTDIIGLGEAYKYAAPLAGAYNFSPEDTSFMLGLTANSGIKGRTGGTTLRTFFANMASGLEVGGKKIATTDENGKMRSLKAIIDDVRISFNGLDEAGKKYAQNYELEEAAKSLGISLKATNGEAKTAIELYGEIAEKTEEMTEAGKVAEAEAISAKTAMSGMLAIINTSADDYNSLADAIYNSKGAAEKMADEMGDNLAGDFALVKSAAEALGIEVGDVLTPKLREMAIGIKDDITAAATWVKENPKTVAGLAGLAAKTIAAVMAVTALKTGWHAASVAFLKGQKAIEKAKLCIKVMNGETEAAASGLGLLGKGLAALGPKGVIAVAAIAAVTAAGFGIANAAKKAKEEWRKSGEEIEKARQKFDEAVSNSDAVQKMAERYRELSKAVQSGKLSAEETAQAQDELRETEKTLIEQSDGFITAEEIKRGEMNKSIAKYEEYINAIKRRSYAELKATIKKNQGELPEKIKERDELEAEAGEYHNRAVASYESVTKMSVLLAELEKRMNSDGTYNGEWTPELSKRIENIGGELYNLYAASIQNGSLSGADVPGLVNNLQASYYTDAAIKEGNKWTKQYDKIKGQADELTDTINTTISETRGLIEAELGEPLEKARERANLFGKAMKEAGEGGISKETLKRLEEYIPGITTAGNKTEMLNEANEELSEKAAAAMRTATELGAALDGTSRSAVNAGTSAEQIELLSMALDKVKRGAELSNEEIEELEKIVPGIGLCADKVTPLEEALRKVQTQALGTKTQVQGLIDLINFMNTLGVSPKLQAELREARASGKKATDWNPPTQKNAKGTDYAADVMIAGENGPELVTGRRGSKVFTAIETMNIFEKLRGFGESSYRDAPDVREPETAKYDLKINFAPVITGYNPEDIGKVLEEERTKMTDYVIKKLNEREKDRRRKAFQ